MKKLIFILLIELFSCNTPNDNKEYQIELTHDSIHVYQHGRFVGSLSHDEIGKLDLLFIIDNQ